MYIMLKTIRTLAKRDPIRAAPLIALAIYSHGPYRHKCAIVDRAGQRTARTRKALEALGPRPRQTPRPDPTAGPRRPRRSAPRMARLHDPRRPTVDPRRRLAHPCAATRRALVAWPRQTLRA